MDKKMVVISDGIAFGKVLNRTNYDCDNYCVNYNPDEELKKFNKAKLEAVKDLNVVKEKINKYTDVSFVDAHIMILNDPMLYKDITKILNDMHCSVEYAFSKAIDVYINLIKEADDEYLKERYLDLIDVKYRLLSILYKDVELSNISADTILCVDEVFPSMLINISPYVKGIIARRGGFMSHSAIICNAKGIVYALVDNINLLDGMEIILDGNKEIIIENPNSEVINEYKSKIDELCNIDLSLINKDKFNIYANVSSEKEVLKASQSKLDGIGLYRSEYIFMGRNDIPSVDEQERIYSNALTSMYPKKVCIRTIDFGDDKGIEYLLVDKKGVSNYFKYYKIFEEQIRALVKSNTLGNLRIMFPMVESHEEYIKLKEIALNINKEYGNKNIEIGIMLETKKALENIKLFKDVDFISIGTNDLVDQLYGIKRDSLTDYKLYIDKLIDDIKPVLEFSNENNIELCVCGAIAGVPNGLKRLIELGIKSYSVNFNALPSIYNILKKYS